MAADNLPSEGTAAGEVAGPAAVCRPYRRTRRGGNRLRPPFRHRPPVYERRRAFAPETEERRSDYKRLFLLALDLAYEAGEVPPLIYTLLNALARRVNPNTLLTAAPSRLEGEERVVCSGWWSLAFIRAQIPDRLASTYDELGAGDAAVEEAAEGMGARRRYDRTAARWMGLCFTLGWVDKIHRSGVINGEHYGSSNLWRLQIPEPYLAQAREVFARRRSKGRTRRSGRYTPPKLAAQVMGPVVLPPASVECPVCAGTGEDPGGEVCGRCGGSRRLLVGRAPP